MRRSMLFFLLAAATLLLLLAAAAFAWGNFRAARSNTTTEHQLGTYRAGQEAPGVVQPGMTLLYAVSGDEPLAEALRWALPGPLQTELAAVANTQLLETAAEDTGQPYLLVELEETTIFWTPVFGQTQIVVEVAFSSDGDVTWRHQLPVVMTSPNGDMVRAHGDFQLNDTSWGLLSQPAYYRLVAEHLAAEITRALQTVFTPV